MKEIWKDILGYEGYQISNLGRVRSLERTIEHTTCYGGLYHIKGKVLKARIEKDGYYRIGLGKNGSKKYFRINRLVAEAFLDKKHFKYWTTEDPTQIDFNELIVNHKDENPLNNCVENLEWATQKYNINCGNVIKKIKKAQSIKIEQYDLENNYIKTWNSINDAIRNYNGNTQICQCCKGKRKQASGYKWKYADTNNLQKQINII